MDEWISPLADFILVGIRTAIARQVFLMVLDWFIKPRKPRCVHANCRVNADLIRQARTSEDRGRCIRVYSPERARHYVHHLTLPGKHEQ